MTMTKKPQHTEYTKAITPAAMAGVDVGGESSQKKDAVLADADISFAEPQAWRRAACRII